MRWPVKRIIVRTFDNETAEVVRDYSELLSERLNSRQIEVYGPEESWDELKFSAEADLSKIGPVFEGKADEIMNILNNLQINQQNVETVKSELQSSLNVNVNQFHEEMIESYPEVLAPDISRVDFFVESDDDRYDAQHKGRVYVDTELTDELEAEGYAREVIRRVQEMRKELDLDVEQAIRLDVQVFDERVGELVARHEELIAEEVRAADLGAVDDGHEREWDVEGVTMRLVVEPLAETVA